MLRYNCGKCWPIFKVLSLLDSAINMQQDPGYFSHRTLSVSLHYPARLLMRTHLTFRKLLMMYVGVVKFGNTNLIFIDPAGLKLTSRTAGRYVLLTEQLLPVMREFLGCSKTVFLYNQPSGMGDTSFHFTRPVAPKKSRSDEPGWLQNFKRNAPAAPALPDERSWRWWTEAAYATSSA